MFSQYKLGELDVKQRKFESAIAHFEAGIAVLDGMIKKRLNEQTATRERGFLERAARSAGLPHSPPENGKHSSRPTRSFFQVC